MHIDQYVDRNGNYLKYLILYPPILREHIDFLQSQIHEPLDFNELSVAGIKSALGSDIAAGTAAESAV